MPPRPAPVLDPRKTPVQARSAASVDAILEATIQVLLQVGKDRLTTTRVALRAGVSVGTLYQYFPNKSALLQAALRRHLDEVTEAVERVCRQQHGNSLQPMATALITAFLQAKMIDPKTSVALYAVSSDLDAAKIVKQLGTRSNHAIVAMLASAKPPLVADPQLIASMLQGAMTGVSRRLLESSAPEQEFEPFRQELIFLACSYLTACSTRPPDPAPDPPTVFRRTRLPRFQSPVTGKPAPHRAHPQSPRVRWIRLRYDVIEQPSSASPLTMTPKSRAVHGGLMRIKTCFGIAIATAVLASAVHASAAVLPEACGKDEVQFKVKTQKKQPEPANPEAGKAQFIFVEAVDGRFMTAPTVRFAVDGGWVGADHGASYFAVSVAPGQHHLCASRQSSASDEKDNLGVATVTAEPGKVYFYELKVIRTEVGSPQIASAEGFDGKPPSLRVKEKPTVDSVAFAALSEDEARKLLKSSALSTSITKP